MTSSSRTQTLTVTISLLLICSLAILLPLSPHVSFSERENRALALFPTLSFQSLCDGTFSRGLSDFYTDQFPFRTLWLALKAEAERLLGAQEVGGILLGKEGYLIPRDEYDDLTVARENLSACRAFLDLAAADGNAATVAVVPRAVDVLTSYLPSLYDPTRAMAVYTPIAQFLPEAISLVEPLREAANQGAPVWYRTDHHWTTDGAYLAYTALAPALDITPTPSEDFTRVTVSSDFLGTSHSASGLLSAQPDTITLYRYAGDEAMEVYIHETRTATMGFYHEDQLATKDQYAVFLGGNYAHLSIRDTANPDKPTLLLFKDSFANALIPFLARHFQLEIVDLRYLSSSVTPLLEQIAPDQILLLLGADTLATNPSFRKLGMR